MSAAASAAPVVGRSGLPAVFRYFFFILYTAFLFFAVVMAARFRLEKETVIVAEEKINRVNHVLDHPENDPWKERFSLNGRMVYPSRQIVDSANEKGAPQMFRLTGFALDFECEPPEGSCLLGFDRRGEITGFRYFRAGQPEIVDTGFEEALRGYIADTLPQFFENLPVFARHNEEARLRKLVSALRAELLEYARFRVEFFRASGENVPGVKKTRSKPIPDLRYYFWGFSRKQIVEAAKRKPVRGKEGGVEVA